MGKTDEDELLKMAKQITGYSLFRKRDDHWLDRTTTWVGAFFMLSGGLIISFATGEAQTWLLVLWGVALFIYGLWLGTYIGLHTWDPHR